MERPKIEWLIETVREVAEREIVARFENVVAQGKADGSVVTEADVRAQSQILEALAAAYPDIPLLGEEMTADAQRAIVEGAEAYWCLDPLDGTSNFASGVPVFCTSLALVQRGEPVLGVVYDPMRRECFSAVRGEGAWLNGRRLALRERAPLELGECVAELDFKRLTPELAARLVREHRFRSQRNFGSASLDWAWLAAGRYQLYLHGGQKMWDYMAGVLIAMEAGVVSTTLEGAPVPTTALVPRSVVAAVDAELHARWLRYLVEPAS